MLNFCTKRDSSEEADPQLRRWVNLLGEKLTEAAFLRSRSEVIESPFQATAEKAGLLFEVRIPVYFLLTSFLGWEKRRHHNCRLYSSLA